MHNLCIKLPDDLLEIFAKLNSSLQEAVAELGEKSEVFLKDLKDNPGLVDFFNGNVNLVDSWKVLSNGKASLRNIDNINAVDAFKKVNPNVSDDAIQSAFDGMKANRKQPFINGLKNVADNDLGLTKARKALPDEVAKSVNDLRDFRKSNPSIGNDKNIGLLEGNINGKSMDELSSNPKWVSGDQTPLTKDPVWDADLATNPKGETYLRDTDSEYKMLNDLARKLEPNAKSGDVFTGHSGQLKVVSEIGYCTSCSGIIHKFNQMFPEIEIILIDGIK